MKRFAWLFLALAAAGITVGQALASEAASVVRGGRLYDHWSRELKELPPVGHHPVLTARRNDMPAAETWRCKECHGWDYQGNHGIVGIRGRQGSDPAAIVAILKNASHRYGGVMSDDDLLDLARFVSRGQVDLPAIVESARRLPPAAAEKYYGTVCGGCHGLDGRRRREIPPLGETARQRSAEMLHVILNGHPDRNMPALRALGTDFAARLLAFLKTLPGEIAAASIAHGGRLYDNWLAEAGAQSPALPHPAYPVAGYFAKDATQTWRCKECHGWDYQGSQGSYAAGRHATGIRGVRAMAGAEPARIRDILVDATHHYDAVLKERDLHDLALFVSAGQLDMDTVIDRRSGRSRGDAARAVAYYDTICAACHGIDGQRINTAPSLGRVARASPWESLHKMMNGHPDERMPALREFDRQMLADILAHLQNLPEGRN